MASPTDFEIAMQALDAAASAIKRIDGTWDVYSDGDIDSGRIIFTAGKTEFILRLAKHV